MRLRTALHVVIGTAFVAALVYFASTVVAPRGSGITGIIAAQQHSPILWIFDVTGVGLVALICFFAFATYHYQAAMEYQTRQYLSQLGGMVERMADIEQADDAYIDRIEQLEADILRRFHDVSNQMSAMEHVADTRRQVFEMEMRRNGESAVRGLQDQVDTTADHVEAITASMQFHRGELRRLRQQVRELQIASPRTAALAGSHLAQWARQDARSIPEAIDAVAAIPTSQPADTAPPVVEQPAPERADLDPQADEPAHNGTNGHAANGADAQPMRLRRAKLSVEGAAASAPSAAGNPLGEEPVRRQAAGRKSRR